MTRNYKENSINWDLKNVVELYRKLYCYYACHFENGCDLTAQVPHAHFWHVCMRADAALKSEKFTKVVPEKKPVLKYIENQTADIGSPYGELRTLLKSLSPYLSWAYGYEAMPEALMEKYAYAEILSPQGPMMAEDLVLGAVMLGPECWYPEHYHVNIAESYVCLIGECWINQTPLIPQQWYYVGPGVTHQIETSKDTPCLLAYAWVGERAFLTHKDSMVMV